MKSLWRRIGKKSLRLARRNAAQGNVCDCPVPIYAVAATDFLSEDPLNDEQSNESEEDAKLHLETERCSIDREDSPPSPTCDKMEAIRVQATRSIDKTIPEEDELEEGAVDVEVDETPVPLAPATSEENLFYENSASYSYGSQFTFHGGLYGYPVAVPHRRLAAVPVIKGFTFTDVDFPLYFSSYDIPVVSASRHASFTRRHRLLRLHNRYTSMPAMRTAGAVSRTSSIITAGEKASLTATSSINETEGHSDA